jgi:hypothetical protein
MTDQTLSLLIIFGGMMLFATIIGVYDLLAERQHRRERERHKSA